MRSAGLQVHSGILECVLREHWYRTWMCKLFDFNYFLSIWTIDGTLHFYISMYDLIICLFRPPSNDNGSSFRLQPLRLLFKQHKQWTKYSKRRHLNIHTNKWMPSGGGGVVHRIGHCFHFVLILNSVLVLCEWVQMCDKQCDGQRCAF